MKGDTYQLALPLAQPAKLLGEIRQVAKNTSLCAVCAIAMSASTSTAQDALSGDRIPASDGEVIVHPINHATLVLGWKGRVIHVDPVGGAGRFKDLPKPDVVLLTHAHGDHLDRQTLSALITPQTAVVSPPTVSAQLPADWRGLITVLTNGQKTTVRDLSVEAVPAYNITPDRAVYHPKGRDNGYVITLGGLRVYVSGDTEATPDMLALKNIGLAFLCMNLPYTMDVDQAARAILAFRPRIVYPYHCRGTDLENLKRLVGTDPKIEVRIANWYP